MGTKYSTVSRASTARPHSRPARTRGPRGSLRVGRDEPLEGPPEQHGEDGLRPEVGREPDELGVEGRDAGGQEPDLLAEDAHAEETERRDEEGAEDALHDLHRGQAVREGDDRAEEVRVERRVEDELQAQRREGDLGRGQDLASPTAATSSRRPPGTWPAPAGRTAAAPPSRPG